MTPAEKADALYFIAASGFKVNDPETRKIMREARIEAAIRRRFPARPRRGDRS